MENLTTPSDRIEIVELQANGFTFRCRTCGMANTGYPVILLHGFPETSQMWTRVLLSLSAQGYRCLAPDLRGYSPGARPAEIADYTIDKIASDVIALANLVGFAKFHLVAHDWGAGCGWTVVQLYPDRVQSWAALSIPHMAAFETAKKTDSDQQQRSWYMGFFQLPLIPELMFGLMTGGNPSSLWKLSAPEEVADYLTVFGNFEGRKATINWYRANHKLPIQYGDVHLPTLLLWGNQDIAVGRTGVAATKQYMKGEYSFVELDAGHTLVQEQFDLVDRQIQELIQRHSIEK
ncbi:MAG: alpha/beta hydrolase [Chamaesiphon sp.]|nr:alpha/beta hydrolase [Chamaesiphon sp.]